MHIWRNEEKKWVNLLCDALILNIQSINFKCDFEIQL